MRLRASVLILSLCAGMAPAQDAGTLADLKQDLSVLYVELQKLGRELNTTGSSGIAVSGGTLDRLNAIESELQRVTAKAEQLEFRINQVVQDGTNRLGDLDFRICELEPGCDIGSLGDTPRLGGVAAPAPSEPAQSRPQPSGSLPMAGGSLAVSEEADFRAAQTALDGGDASGAAQLFASFRETYPRSPLEAAALLGEGRALEANGDMREAARRYLTGYSSYPESPVAAESLWRLGTSLAALGSVQEACVTLAEVAARYPASEYVSRAAQSRSELGCS